MQWLKGSAPKLVLQLEACGKCMRASTSTLNRGHLPRTDAHAPGRGTGPSPSSNSGVACMRIAIDVDVDSHPPLLHRLLSSVTVRALFNLSGLFEFISFEPG